jgi:hypothetical protein
MRKSKITLATVRKIGLGLPGVEEATAFGAFALKVGGKLMACVPTHRSAEPGSLMVRADSDAIRALVEEAPEVYYVPDHYAGYNAVLVRLSYVNADAMRDLLGMAHKFVTGRKSRR